MFLLTALSCVLGAFSLFVAEVEGDPAYLIPAAGFALTGSWAFIEGLLQSVE